MEWGIVVDSSCDLIEKEISEKDMDVSVVPLTMLVGSQHFPDLPQTDVNEMLQAMENYMEGSKSACPSPQMFLDACKKSSKVIVLTLTSGLSGTYNSAKLASEMFKEETKNNTIHVVDSHSTAGQLALLVYKTKELIRENKTFDEVVEGIEEYNRTLRLAFTLGSYDNLVKTGRMKALVGNIAEKLNIRVFAVNTSEGTIQLMKKAHGASKIYQLMVDWMGSIKDLTNQPVVISHCNNPEGANKLAQLIKQQLHTDNIQIQSCRCLTSFYAMSGGILVGF